MKKQDLNSKYGGSRYQTYSLIKQNADHYIGLDEQSKGIEIFGQQLEVFGQDCNSDTIYYKPFSILKICYDGDESELIMEGNIEMYSKLSDNQTITIDLSNKMVDNAEALNNFWQSIIVPGKFEGIIVKPDIVDPNCAPCLKVRNSNYLHIIHGPDYLTNEKYSALIKKKHIRDKLEASIREYQLGQEMLKVKYGDITDSNCNNHMTNLYYSFFEEKEREKTFDKVL